MGVLPLGLEQRCRFACQGVVCLSCSTVGGGLISRSRFSLLSVWFGCASFWSLGLCWYHLSVCLASVGLGFCVGAPLGIFFPPFSFSFSFLFIFVFYFYFCPWACFWALFLVRLIVVFLSCSFLLGYTFLCVLISVLMVGPFWGKCILLHICRCIC